jgi:hypothetical protein
MTCRATYPCPAGTGTGLKAGRTPELGRHVALEDTGDTEVAVVTAPALSCQVGDPWRQRVRVVVPTSRRRPATSFQPNCESPARASIRAEDLTRDCPEFCVSDVI